MRKSMYLIGLVTIALLGAGCSKSGSKGTTQAYAPNSCYSGLNNNGYNSGYNNNGYNNSVNNSGYQNSGYNNQYGNNSYGQRYQWQNTQCIDTTDGDIVAQSLCNNVQYSNSANCTNYGYGNNYVQGNSFQQLGGANACAIYNNGSEVFYPVYYPALGTMVCAGYSTIQSLYSYGYGLPSYYNGNSGVYQGCIPGVPGGYNGRCNCRSFGGRLGWIQAGVQMGVCY